MFDEALGYRHQFFGARERAEACRAAAVRVRLLGSHITDGLQDCIDALTPHTWSSPTADARRSALAEADQHLRHLAEALRERAIELDQAANRLERQAAAAWLDYLNASGADGAFAPVGRQGRR